MIWSEQSDDVNRDPTHRQDHWLWVEYFNNVTCFKGMVTVEIRTANFFGESLCNDSNTNWDLQPTYCQILGMDDDLSI